MKSDAFLNFIHNYSYPTDFYTFHSAEEDVSNQDSLNDKNINKEEQYFYFLSGFSAKLIHTTLEKSSFTQTSNLYQAPLIVGSKQNEDLQKYLKPYQRMTHFLYTQVIGQKVGLHVTLSKFMNFYGISLPFYPKTYLIPQQLEEFKKYVSTTKYWIEKPSCGSCGRGILIVSGMPKSFITRQVVMQEYIRNPLLIHGYKFDLRFYVAVTSLNPLRIYNYNDGLVRFATEKYALFFEDVSNLSAHLTNFSINKESEKFQVTNDVKNDGKGSKWSHVPFWPFLDSLNFDVDDIKNKIDDAIAIIIFSARNNLARQRNHRCSFELYGFDVLLTVDGEIHVLEVNISPALGTSSNLDMHIKAPLVRDFFNLAMVPKRTEKQMRIEAAFSFENDQQFGASLGAKQHQSESSQHQNENNQHQNENGQHQNENNQHQNENNQHQNENGQHQNENNQHQNENGQHQNENGQHQNENNQHQNENNQHQNENNQHQNENGQHQNESIQHQNENNQHQNESIQHQNESIQHQNENIQHQNENNQHQNENNQHQNENNQHQNENIQHQNESTLQSLPPSVLSDVASLAAVCEFELAEQRLGGFRRVYPTPGRAAMLDSLTTRRSAKTRLDLVLERWIRCGEAKRRAFIDAKLPSYRAALGDLIDAPREFCSVS